MAASRFSRGRGRVEEKDGGMEGRGEAMQERRTKRGVVGWPYFLSGELYGGALRYDRRMDYHFSLFPPPPRRPPPSRHSPFTLRPSLEPFLRVHPVRKLASSTLSLPSRHPPAKTCKAEWAKGGWLVGRGRREGPSKGGSNDVTRGWERVEGSWKGDQGRTFREMFLFPCPFSSFRPLLPTRSSFLAPREDGSTGEREGGKRKKREKREEKGRCKPREKGLGGGVRRVGYVATDRYMNKRGYV